MKGKVIKSTGNWYATKTTTGQYIECRLKGKMRLEEIKLTNPVVVGDWVEIENEIDSGDTVISQIYPRENYIIRQSPRQKFHDHIIASNIDQAILLVTIAKPRTSFGFMDRFLTAAACYHIPVSIVVNKADLLSEKDKGKLKELHLIYEKLGYPIYVISVLQSTGIDEIKQLLKNKCTLIAGHSGVGKSSLINVLDANVQIKTGKISSRWDKGMHTTTFAMLHELDDTTQIIDTPGIKEFALTDVDPEELGGYFPEIYQRMSACQFNNCLHENEPRCAVLRAVEEEEIHPDRYHSYLQILDNVREIKSYQKRLNP